MWRPLSLSCVILFAACGPERESEVPSSETPARAEPAPAPEAPAPGSATPEPVPSTTEAAPAGGTEDVRSLEASGEGDPAEGDLAEGDPAAEGLPNAAEDIDALAEAVGVALEAAGEAEVGAETCAVAYESMSAAAQAIEARLPGSTNPLPARSLFLTACRRFPEPAQQCLITRYAVAHADECLAIQAQVPEDVRRGLERLLAGPQ